MARLGRYVIPGQAQHIIQRGNNRQAIFAAEADYQFFRDALVEAAAEHGLAIHAYVWMTNHVHLLVSPEFESSISKVFQSVGRRYVQYFNHTYERSGTLWEGRYRATVVDSERYLLTVMRYIELNPVRAGLSSADEATWTSHQAYLGTEPAPEWLVTDELRDLFGPVPDQVTQFLELTQIRIRAAKWNIQSIIVQQPDVIFTFPDGANATDLFARYPGTVRIPDPRTVHLRLDKKYFEPKTLLAVLRKLLRR
mgnify:CR=1 FL=1